MASVKGIEIAEKSSSFVPSRIIAELGAWLESRGKIRKRIRHNEEVGMTTPVARHQYETVGYLVEGRAQLEIEGQRLLLEPGDSWVVPAGAEHRFTILEPFTAVEATDAARPARYRARSVGSD